MRCAATGGGATWVLAASDGRCYDLSRSADGRLRDLDAMMRVPREELFDALAAHERTATPDAEPGDLLAPVEGQEVWAAGVTYRRSRDARMEESAVEDVYDAVYRAERPELFFKAAGWRVIGDRAAVGIRGDSTWDVPEPELAVLLNARAEPVAYCCANDMSSRSIEGENPLYLPQAKVYDRSCALGPAAVLASGWWPAGQAIGITIERAGALVYEAHASLDEMVRDPHELGAVLFSCYTLPVGAWLMTGTTLVPPEYSARPGDIFTVSIEGIGKLTNPAIVITHSGATARPIKR
jgi:2-dehydro-3-deoxy-D-arabinonate dehydratase